MRIRNRKFLKPFDKKIRMVLKQNPQDGRKTDHYVIASVGVDNFENKIPSHFRLIPDQAIQLTHGIRVKILTLQYKIGPPLQLMQVMLDPV